MAVIETMAAFLDMYKATAVAIAAAEFFALLKVKLEVIFLYPAYFSENKAENP